MLTLFTLCIKNIKKQKNYYMVKNKQIIIWWKKHEIIIWCM